jgi:hypothetical protein
VRDSRTCECCQMRFDEITKRLDGFDRELEILLRAVLNGGVIQTRQQEQLEISGVLVDNFARSFR